MSAPAASAEPSAPPARWEGARHVLGWLFALFGGPEAIVAFGRMTRAEHAEVCAWLRPVEAIARALLLVEAAALPRPVARPVFRASPKRAARRVRERIDQNPDDAEAWRVIFRVCVRHRRGRRAAAEEGWGDDPLITPWALAERAEAVRRVLDDPAPFAARLARRIAVAPERVRTILAGAGPPRARGRPVLGGAALEEAQALAAAAFDTS